MTKVFLLQVLLLFSSVCSAQVKTVEFDSLLTIAIDKGENLHLPKNLNQEQAVWLRKIKSGKTLKSGELLPYVRYIHTNKKFSALQLSKLIHGRLKKTSRLDIIDLDYVRIKWHEIKSFRDEGDLKRANKIHENLKTYVATFKQKNVKLEKAKILLLEHDIILNLISRKIDTGVQLSEKSMAKARLLKDTNLLILSMFNRCEFFIHTGQLNEFIEMSERCYSLDSSRNKKSFFYMPNLMHLVDAYIFEGKHINRSLSLLEKIHSNQNYTVDSYAYYMKLLANTAPENVDTLEIFGLVEANKFFAFYKKTKKLSEKWLTPLDYYQFLREASYALYQYGHSKEALKSMEEAAAQIKTIYSADLSQTIAEYEKNKLEYEKNQEIEHTQELATLYMWSTILICIFALLTIVTLIRKVLQNKALALKNRLISKKEREKSLLMKELNHRVKNNFQIISSVLAMQARTIENNQVREIFDESQRRVSAMALTHEKLHSNDNPTQNLKAYLEDLTKDLKLIPQGKKISFHLLIDDTIQLNVEKSMPIGLIINELITNTVKHSMIDRSEGQITIRIEKIGFGMRLTYTDSGSGIDKSIDLEKSKTLGIKLIRGLTTQLNGEVKYVANTNTFEFVIP